MQIKNSFSTKAYSTISRFLLGIEITSTFKVWQANMHALVPTSYQNSIIAQTHLILPSMKDKKVESLFTREPSQQTTTKQLLEQPKLSWEVGEQ